MHELGLTDVVAIEKASRVRCGLCQGRMVERIEFKRYVLSNAELGKVIEDGQEGSHHAASTKLVCNDCGYLHGIFD